jgi:predicted amidohydrolase
MLAAVVQLTSTADGDRNLDAMEHWVRRAAQHGADFVATPEATNYLGPHADKVRLAEPLDGVCVTRASRLARELKIHLLLGSFNERSEDPQRCYNTSVLIGPDGTTIAIYRKMHLFDVDHSDAVRFFESATCVPGDTPVVGQTAIGRIGLGICYDLRFPELFRWHVEHGAEILCVPSAFTATTGAAHWHALLRARAIETQSYVIAPGQVGRHGDDGLRETYGHSLIVDPWGTIIAEASEGPGIALGDIDLERVRRIRAAMPVHRHRRL